MRPSWLLVSWCRRRDSNSHSFRHYPLKIACLPISPRRLETSILPCLSSIFQCSNCAKPRKNTLFPNFSKSVFTTTESGGRSPALADRSPPNTTPPCVRLQEVAAPQKLLGGRGCRCGRHVLRGCRRSRGRCSRRRSRGRNGVAGAGRHLVRRDGHVFHHAAADVRVRTVGAEVCQAQGRREEDRGGDGRRFRQEVRRAAGTERMARTRRKAKTGSTLLRSADFIGWALGGLEREIAATRERLAALTAQAATLRSRVGLGGGGASKAKSGTAGGRRGRRRRMTPEGRKRISEMMKRRWAEAKKKNRNHL